MRFNDRTYFILRKLVEEGVSSVPPDLKQRVLLTIYVEYQKDIPNMQLVTPSALGIDKTSFEIAIDKLQNELLIKNANIVRGGRNPHPRLVFLKNVMMTPEGIQYAENLLMIEPIDSAESKLKTIIKKSTEWGFEQLKDFAAKVMAELLKN